FQSPLQLLGQGLGRASGGYDLAGNRKGEPAVGAYRQFLRELWMVRNHHLQFVAGSQRVGGRQAVNRVVDRGNGRRNGNAPRLRVLGGRRQRRRHDDRDDDKTMAQRPLHHAPSPVTTAFTVRNITAVSSQSERVRTYRTSHLIICWKEFRLRPLTCARPVTPGRTANFSNCSPW